MASAIKQLNLTKDSNFEPHSQLELWRLWYNRYHASALKHELIYLIIDAENPTNKHGIKYKMDSFPEF